jgi:hypothetical protein
MKIYNILIAILLALCLVGVAYATNFESDGHAFIKQKLYAHENAHKTNAKNVKSANIKFKSAVNSNNCIDNTKNIAVYMPSLTSNLKMESSSGTTTTTATYDPYCTAMFYEYNPDYLNDATITSKLKKENYDLLVVPMSEMSDTAALAINNYLLNGGSVWFLSDPSLLEDGSVSEDRIDILGGTTDTQNNLISSSSTITVDNTDTITSGLPNQFKPLGGTEKWSFFRSFGSQSGIVSGFNYKILMNNLDCAMLIKYENPLTGARAIYSNVNMFVSGGDCSYFDANTATNLFLQTKSWLLKLNENSCGVEITSPKSDKQLTISLDDVEGASFEDTPAQPFFDMEKTHGIDPVSINTFFIIPDSNTDLKGLQYFSQNGDTHTLHPHDITVWDNSQKVSQYKSDFNIAKGIINKAAGVYDYGITSIRFPFTSYCLNSQKALAKSGFLIDSSNGRWTGGVYIGTPEDNNLMFPKQMLLDSKKTNVIEMEATSSFDLENSPNQYIQDQLVNMPYLKSVNFPSDFVIGGHYQSDMTDPNMIDAVGQILEASKSTGTAYITFDALAKYMNGVKKAKIVASTTNGVTTITVNTQTQIDNFTVKITKQSTVSAKYDDIAIPSSGIKQDGNVWYVTNTVSPGTHKFTIKQ